MIRDPVAAKELSGLSRRWQTYVARVLYIGLFLTVLWTHASQLRDVRSWMSQSALAGLSRDLFNSFMMLQLVLVVLAAVSSACDLVTKEVRLGTLGLLVCTPLSPWRVTFGKWRAAMAQTASLLFCGLPILGLCSAMGGATPREVLVITAVSAAAAGLGAALSIYCSSRFRTPSTALIAATGSITLYGFLPELVGATPGGMIPGVWSTLWNHLHLVNALAVGISPIQGFPDDVDAWVAAAATTTGLSLLILRLTAARISTLSVATPAPPMVDRAFEAMDRFYEGLGPERFRKRRFFAASSEVWEDNSLLWKELKTRASGRLRNSVRIALALLIVLAVCFHLELEALWIPAWATTLIFWFLALANGASLFVKEKEERKWDILLATPLPSTRIVHAKLQAGAVPVLPVLGTILFFWGIQAGTTILRPGELSLALLAVVLPGLLAYILGAVCSLHARSLRAAFGTGFTGLLALMAAVPWLCSEFEAPDRGNRSFMSPISMIGQLVHTRRHFGYSWNDLDFGDCLPFMTIYTLLIGGLLAYLQLRFDAVTGRSE